MVMWSDSEQDGGEIVATRDGACSEIAHCSRFSEFGGKGGIDESELPPTAKCYSHYVPSADDRDFRATGCKAAYAALNWRGSLPVLGDGTLNM